MTSDDGGPTGDLAANAAIVRQLLARVAAFGANVISGADGVGVCLLHLERQTGRIENMAVSHPFFEKIDAIYELLDDGPPVTAAEERAPVRSGNISADPRWPRFGPRLGRLGVHSVMSLPMTAPDDGAVVGAITAYSHLRKAFTADALSLGEMFAAASAVALHNARATISALTRVEQLQRTLDNRPIIDQAIGIIRSRTGSTTEEALGRLREISQHENVKLVVLAGQIVDEAVRRAAGRRDRN